ncbi:carboxymuconolactone decarboxylase family protein [Frigoribacterium sp. VKM Ac-2530]|uniref:carboxymuconolactone decarboxylase family protein n=1 Tax=Frigoribacterium sp. VKM Ac-2530 TaxID=2783822 RepID=UPI00188C9C2F|nr:carboxymuconolactone decarboxylase family protein [Frigoribacterium sp. VKM Ac-2530]
MTDQPRQPSQPSQPDQPRQVGGGRASLGDFAPKLAELTDDVLFADVWNRPELSARDRSLITVAVLAAGGHTGQLPFHLGRALENGVRRDELIEAITHVTLYAGWPNGMAAMAVAKDALGSDRDEDPTP